MEFEFGIGRSRRNGRARRSTEDQDGSEACGMSRNGPPVQQGVVVFSHQGTRDEWFEPACLPGH